MHEMGIVFQMMDTLRDVMKQNSIKSLQSVTVNVGEASMVVPSYLSDCWSAAIPNTEFKDTKLLLVMVTAEGKCNQCGRVFPIKKCKQKCPHCGSNNDFVTISGTQMEIASVVAYD